jgi:hypothetical protein
MKQFPIMGKLSRAVLPSTSGCAWMPVIWGCHLMRNLGIVALGAALAAGPGHAGDYPPACRSFTSFSRGDLGQPARPPCLDYLVDRATIEMCQPFMELYQLEVPSYIECLKSENNSIVETFNAAAKQFNCAQNKTAC